VPVLQSGALTLTETPAILGWIAARYPQAKLFPEDADQRARAEALLLQASAYLYPVGVMRLFLFDAYVRANGGTPDAEAVTAAAEATAPLLDAFATRIAGPFLLGGAPCAADILLATMVHNVALTSAGAALIAARPPLAAWFGRMAARPAFRSTEVPIPLFGL